VPLTMVSGESRRWSTSCGARSPQNSSRDASEGTRRRTGCSSFPASHAARKRSSDRSTGSSSTAKATQPRPSAWQNRHSTVKCLTPKICGSRREARRQLAQFPNERRISEAFDWRKALSRLYHLPDLTDTVMVESSNVPLSEWAMVGRSSSTGHTTTTHSDQESTLHGK